MPLVLTLLLLLLLLLRASLAFLAQLQQHSSGCSSGPVQYCWPLTIRARWLLGTAQFVCSGQIVRCYLNSATLQTVARPGSSRAFE